MGNPVNAPLGSGDARTHAATSSATGVTPRFLSAAMKASCSPAPYAPLLEIIAMDAKYACKSPEHAIARRKFLGSMAAVGASEGPFWTTAIELGDRYSGTAFGIFNTGGNLGGLLAPSVTPLVCAHLPTAWDEVFRWKLAISLGSVVCILGAALWWKIDPDAPTTFVEPKTN